MLKRNSRNYYLEGGWNVICDRCGFKKKNTEVKLEWDNLIVCIDKCWEPRQPQDFVRAVPDMKPVTRPRPEPPDVFVPDRPFPPS